MIAAFELVEEKFKTLPPPDFTLNEWLSLLINSGRFYEQGGYERIRCDRNLDQDFENRIIPFASVAPINPLCYLNNNETILVRLPKNNLMFWDTGDEEFNNGKIGCIQGDRSVENVYGRNLISLNHINGFTTEDIDNSFLFYI
ncbi:hypothetical protein Dsin_028260 [Dipteronia sinensis]|uniref:Uncharacterized protein n=1 Tax=Dipteronia sinensis TaxID=43782 RepID=A0AAD9ZQT6_9ROSI|nr:hypothetical protein Dsin_028260 [Dipteronia sinensis]